METIYTHFSRYNKDDVNDAFFILEDTEKKLYLLMYPYDLNKKGLSCKEISKKLNIRYSKIHFLIGKIEEKLENQLKILEEIRIENSKTDEEKANDKINELKKEILSNNFNNDNVIFRFNSMKVSIREFKSNCLLAKLSKESSTKLNRTNSIKRDCLIYIISLFDKTGKISEDFIIKDKKSNKIYKFVYAYTNGEYDLSSVNYDELVCYNIYKTHIDPIPIKESESENNITVQDSKESNLQNEFDINLDPFKETLEEGIKLFVNEKYIDKIKSEKYFLKALKSKNKYILQKAYLFLGKLYLDRRRFDISYEYVDKCLKLDNNYEALLTMAKVLSFQNKFDEALEIFEKCKEMDCNNIDPFIEKGKCYMRNNDFDNALREINCALSINPNNYFVLYEKAKLLFNFGQYTEAKFILYNCDRICSQFKLFYNHHKIILGEIEYLCGDKEIAKMMFDEIIKYDNRKNVVENNINYIAYFFHSLGEKELAYQYYLMLPSFKKWHRLSEKEIENHIKLHEDNIFNESAHSIFNFSVDLDLLNLLIKDIEKTSTRESLDVYEIYCENAGYFIDNNKRKIKQDYIIINTFPFTKRIAFAYPSNRTNPKNNTKYLVKLEDLKNYTLCKNNKTESLTKKLIITTKEN